MQTNPEKDLAQEVALFRYGLIADLLRTPARSAAMGALVREKASRRYRIPGSRRVRVSEVTLAFVRDMGSAMAKAVTACRTPPRPELVCHFHFLAAVGGRLQEADHATLRSDLARWKVRSGLRDLLRSARRPGFAVGGSERGTDLAALLYWALEGDGGR